MRNVRELRTVSNGNGHHVETVNRFEDVSNPVRLAQTANEKYSEYTKEVGNRTETREFNQHMQMVRRRTEEQFRQSEVDHYARLKSQPKKLSEHKRKHLHLYSKKNTKPPIHRSQASHGVQLYSPRSNENHNEIQAQTFPHNNEQVDVDNALISEKHIVKTYRYETEQNGEVEERKQIDYKMVKGMRTTESLSRMSDALNVHQHMLTYEQPEQDGGQFGIDDKSANASYKQSRNKSKRNIQRTEKSDQDGNTQSVFRKLHENAQHLYSNLNADTGRSELNDNITANRYQRKVPPNQGNASNNTNNLENRQISLGQSPQTYTTVAILNQKQDPPQYYQPEGQRLVDKKLEQIRRRSKQIQQQIDIRTIQTTRVQPIMPFQAGQLGMSNEVNRSIDVFKGKGRQLTEMPVQNILPSGGSGQNQAVFQQAQQRVYQAKGLIRPQGIMTQNFTSNHMQKKQEEELPQILNEFKRASPQLNAIIAREILKQQQPQQQQLPEAMKIMKSQQGKFNQIIIRQTNPKQPSQQPQISRQPSQPTQAPQYQIQQQPQLQQYQAKSALQSGQQRMPQFFNQLKQHSQQLDEIIVKQTKIENSVPLGGNQAVGRTEPTRMSYQSEEQFDDSDNETPKIYSNRPTSQQAQQSKQKQLQQQARKISEQNSRMQQGAQLDKILFEGNTSRKDAAQLDQDIAAGSIIDDLGRGGSGVQTPSQMAMFKHSEFQPYNSSSNLAVGQKLQISTQNQQNNNRTGGNQGQSTTVNQSNNQQQYSPLPGFGQNKQQSQLLQQVQLSQQRDHVHITPVQATQQSTNTVTLGSPLTDNSGLSNKTLGGLKTQVQQTHSPSPVRTSGFQLAQPVFYSPPHAGMGNVNTNQNPTKVLNERMAGLAQLAINTSQTNMQPSLQQQINMRRSGVVDSTQPAYQILPNQLPTSDRNMQLRPMTMNSTTTMLQQSANPTFSYSSMVGAVPTLSLTGPAISSSHVLLPPNVKNSKIITTPQIIPIGTMLSPPSSHLPNNYYDQNSLDTERRLIGPAIAGFMQGSVVDQPRQQLPVTQVSQLPVQINSHVFGVPSTPPPLPTVSGTEKKKHKCFDCCCSIF